MGTGLGKTTPNTVHAHRINTGRESSGVYNLATEYFGSRSSTSSVFEHAGVADIESDIINLKALRFNAMGIPAMAINKETWKNPRIKQLIDSMHPNRSNTNGCQYNIAKNRYRAIFAGPEMTNDHVEFRQLLRKSGFTNNTIGIVVDEAHVTGLRSAS